MGQGLCKRAGGSSAACRWWGPTFPQEVPGRGSCWLHSSPGSPASWEGQGQAGGWPGLSCEQPRIGRQWGLELLWVQEGPPSLQISPFPSTAALPPPSPSLSVVPHPQAAPRGQSLTWGGGFGKEGRAAAEHFVPRKPGSWATAGDEGSLQPSCGHLHGGRHLPSAKGGFIFRPASSLGPLPHLEGPG